MELTLTSGDLRPECRDTPCSATRFANFTDEAQAAVRIVGRARFETNGGSNYNAVYPPPTGRPPKGRVAFPPEDRPCGDCGFVHNESFCPRCEGDGEEDLYPVVVDGGDDGPGLPPVSASGGVRRRAPEPPMRDDGAQRRGYGK